MKRMKARKWLASAALLLVAALLAGCTATPDNTGANGNNTQDIIPFPIRSPGVTGAVTPTPTIGAVINLPTGSPQAGQSTTGIWGNINFGTGNPFQTPTPTVWGGLVILTMSPGLPSPSPTSSVLRLGSTGPAVRAVQQRLRDLGYAIGSVDGDFGATTEAAVKAFQARNGLAADGVVGAATLTRLNGNSALPPRPTPTPTPRPTATPRISENVFLKLGATGSEVRAMQARLIELGYLMGQPNGRFDEITEAAVYAFQQRNTSYADGIAGPLTLQKLYSSSARGTSAPQGIIGTSIQRGMMDSPAVRRIQTRLRDLGFYSGGIDGDFGASTEAAIKAFQSANGLTPDGKVGAATYRALFDTGANGPGRTATPRPNVTPTPTRIPNYVVVTPHPDGLYVTLREGNSGELVRALQQALKNQGFFDLEVDGLFGFGTTAAVKEFQKSKGLSQDGLAGPATQRILFEGNFPTGS